MKYFSTLPLAFFSLSIILFSSIFYVGMSYFSHLPNLPLSVSIFFIYINVLYFNALHTTCLVCFSLFDIHCSLSLSLSRWYTLSKCVETEQIVSILSVWIASDCCIRTILISFLIHKKLFHNSISISINEHTQHLHNGKEFQNLGNNKHSGSLSQNKMKWFFHNNFIMFSICMRKIQRVQRYTFNCILLLFLGSGDGVGDGETNKLKCCPVIKTNYPTQNESSFNNFQTIFTMISLINICKEIA